MEDFILSNGVRFDRLSALYYMFDGIAAQLRRECAEMSDEKYSWDKRTALMIRNLRDTLDEFEQVSAAIREETGDDD